jgi:hypothetical protein
MKNIFLKPTDKESLLHKSHNILITSTQLTGKSDLYNSTPHFIYITNDEKFKKDDWVTDGIKVIKASSKVVDAQDLINRRNWKKIVLSNDSSIDVQQVTDSFLSFFAENKPDYVEVKTDIKAFDGLNRPICNVVLFDDYTKTEYILNFPKNKNYE